MPRAIRAFALTLFSASIFCLLLTAAVPAADLSTPQNRNWHQPHANAFGNSFVDVKGVTVPPTEAWRLAFDKVHSDIVVWDGVIYAVVQEGKKIHLIALLAADGTELARTSLRSADSFWLGVWQNTVSVLTPTSFRSYTLQDSKFKAGKNLRGEFDRHGLLAEELAVIPQIEGPTLVLDAPRAKELTSVRGGRGSAAVYRDQVAVADLRTDNGWYGRRLTLDLYDLEINGRKSKAEHADLMTSGKPRVKKGTEESDDVYVIAVPRVEKETVWFIKSPLPLATISKRRADSALLPGDSLSIIANRPAIWQEQVIGFDYDQRLVAMNANGAVSGVIDADDLPTGALQGPLSVAGNCLYLGNWAVDLESKDILWVDTEIHPLGPLVPVADGRFAYRSVNHEIIFCQAGSNASAGGLAVNASADADGWGVLSDEWMGEDFLTHTELRKTLNEPIWQMFEQQFHAYLDARAMDDCRRLVEDAADWDLPADRGRALAVAMAGKRRVSKGNFEKTLEKLQSGESQARAEVVKQFINAAGQCSQSGQALAASALLAEAERFHPGTTAVRDAGRDLMPGEFPFARRPRAVELWLKWAEELMPAGAEFIAEDHPLWKRVRGTIWARNTLGLRTDNVILLIRSEDPEVVGSCLRNAEGTVRTLNFLVRNGEPEMERGRLQVRVFGNRSEYLKVPNTQGFVAMPWSAGYYSPDDRISRFYIPDLNDPFAGRGRQFQNTLVHEITHQYLSQRWLAERTVATGPLDQPGYWIVEGFARFIEDQLMELGQPSMGFNDPRGPALDYSACIAEKTFFLAPQKLVELSKSDFNEIGDKDYAMIKLKNSLLSMKPSKRTTFYEEAGSLVFYMLNRRGAEGRKALIEYMRLYYLGQLDGPGWKLLGFESEGEMEELFRTFLKTVHNS